MVPPCKKSKLEENCRGKCENTVELEMPNEGRRSTMESVLDDILTRDVETVQIVAGRILNKKETRSVIIQLNAKHPIPSLTHLKRVNRDWIIIKEGDTTKEIQPFLETLNFDFTLLGDFKIVVVPKTAPMTRKQFESANKKWPCNFHENKHLEKLANNRFSSEEMNEHEKWMSLTIQTARTAGRQSATVIVDPSSGLVICKSADDRATHPMHHSVMLAIDLVAKAQNGGAWNHRESLGSCDSCTLTLDETSEGPYLCTGFYVYTTREPCVMCAMALIHSRAKSVFYGTSMRHGALGSVAKIHTIKELNHHYEVFRGLLKDECAKI